MLLVGVKVRVAVAVLLGVKLGVLLLVGVKVRVAVAVLLGVKLGVLLLVGVKVRVAVAVLLGVKLGVLLLVGVKVRVAVGVLVGVAVAGLATAFTAAPASSMPLPHCDVVQVLPLGNGLAVFCRICSTCAGVRDGLRENIRETTPVTWGAAMLVPW